MRNYLKGIWWGAWIISPIVILTMIVIPLTAAPPARSGWIVLIGLEIVCLALLVAMWCGPLRWPAMRVLGGCVFIGYLIYMITELVSGNLTSPSRAQHSALNALIGLGVYGVPGLLLAIKGSALLSPKPGSDEPEDPDGDADDGDLDSTQEHEHP